jgi:hypothetical protein
MNTNLEKIWAVDVQDEDAFLCFLFKKAPRNSYWIIELHCLQAEDEVFLAQLGEPKNKNDTSKLFIPLTEIVRSKLKSRIHDTGGLIHHKIDTSGELFMVSYDSFSIMYSRF